jgi:phenylalanyl-tRNA synthetase beta chain
MKIVESWLREWVDPDLDSKALGHQLTMLGLEVDGVGVEGDGLDGVVIAEVVEAETRSTRTRIASAFAR